jgi:ligand-binding sensor domain-containing protein
MKTRVARLLLFFLIIVPHFLSAQFQRYRNYDVKDGLPSSEVYDVLQDKRGFLWFSTDLGVSRYDGYAFTNYTTDDGLPDNTIFDVTEDHAGRIWFTSFSGKLSYFLNERIYTLPCNDALSGKMFGNYIKSLYVDEGDTIWAGSTGKFSFCIAPGWNVQDIDSFVHPSHEGFLILVDETGLIYGGGTGAGSQLNVYNRAYEKLYSLKLFEESTGLLGVRYSFCRSAYGNIIVTVNNHIITFNKSGILASADLGAIGICTLLEEDGSVLAGTYDGVGSWNSTDLTSHQKISKFDKKIVTAILRDSEGGMWYCTEGNGVYFSANSKFLYYTYADGLPESKITSATIHDDIIYTGHIDGIVCRLQGQSVQRLIPEPAGEIPGASNRITSIIRYSDKEILASTASHYYAIGISDSKVRRIEERGCKKMIRGRDGCILAFRFRSLAKFSLENFRKIYEIPFNLYADHIYELQNGQVWICAIDGVWTYDGQSPPKYLGDSIPELATRVTGTQETEGNALWISTRGNGVLVIHDGDIYRIKRADGLASNMCRALYVDNANTVWVGTTSGLSRISFSLDDSLKYVISNYTSENGLLSNDVNDVFGSDDKLYAVHTSGISVLDPSVASTSTFAPPVYITGVTVNGDSVSTADNAIEYDENRINFSFVGLSFRDPGKVRYRYKLEGAPGDWVYTNVTSAAYQELQPGDYKFVVQASTNDGIWSAAEATAGFTIVPTWWQTWWFRIAAVFIIALLVSVGFRARVGQIRRRESSKTALQNRLATFELNALRAQMNPHFVFNAINSVQYFITENDPDSSQKYLSKFAKLIRYVVDNSRLSYISVKAEIEALTLYLELEALRFGDRMKYSFEIDDEVDTEYLQIPSMLIQPYIENSIWHGIMHKEGAGEIKIKLSMKDNTLCCVVEDNGVGRAKAMEIKKKKPVSLHKSVGMTNTRERLEIINQVSKNDLSVVVTDLYSENNEPRGTRVELRVPVNH